MKEKKPDWNPEWGTITPITPEQWKALTPEEVDQVMSTGRWLNGMPVLVEWPPRLKE